MRVNRTFLRWTGFAREDLVDVKRFQDLLTAGGRIYHETHYAPLLRMQGSVREIVHAPRHPYTLGLLHANVRPGQRNRPEAIPGSPPNLARLPAGCAFAPRCAFVTAQCLEATPALISIAGTHSARCVLVESAVRAAALPPSD